jgi:hypothetical protein
MPDSQTSILGVKEFNLEITIRIGIFQKAPTSPDLVTIAGDEVSEVLARIHNCS